MFYIDSYHENTGDKAYYNGHYYTDKSIGPSIIAVPAYFFMKHLPLLNLFVRSSSIAIVSTWISTSLPSALLGMFFFLFLSKFASKLWYAIVITMAYGLGTIAFPYSTVMFQHQTATAGLFIGFYFLWRVVAEDASWYWLWLVGTIFGFTVISDYMTALLIGMMILWMLYKTHNFRLLIPIIIGTIPAMLIFFLYNWINFGSPLTLGYSYTLWVDVQGQGFFGLTSPNLKAFWGITFSSFRGLFFISPFLLFGFHGLYIMWKEKVDRSLVILFSILIIITFLYNSSAVMWWAGWSIGPRYSIPAIPFLAFPIIFSVKRISDHNWTCLLFLFLLVMSFANVWIQTLSTNELIPDIYDYKSEPENGSTGKWTLEQVEEGNIYDFPLVQYSIPNLLRGNWANNLVSSFIDSTGIITFVPLFLLWGIAIIVIEGIYKISIRNSDFKLNSNP